MLLVSATVVANLGPEKFPDCSCKENYNRNNRLPGCIEGCSTASASYSRMKGLEDCSAGLAERCAFSILFNQFYYLWLNQAPVHLPNDPEWLPPRLLRTAAQRHDHRHIQRRQRPIARHQHLLRSSFRHPGCGRWLPFLPRQNPPTVLLSLSPRRHAARI